jgi:hypothetical protein
MRAPPTGQTVVVENRPGANGGIAINALISSPANGQTFVATALWVSMLREPQLAAGSRLPGKRINVPVAARWYGPLLPGDLGGGSAFGTAPVLAAHPVGKLPSNHSPATLKIGE